MEEVVPSIQLAEGTMISTQMVVVVLSLLSLLSVKLFFGVRRRYMTIVGGHEIGSQGKFTRFW